MSARPTIGVAIANAFLKQSEWVDGAPMIVSKVALAQIAAQAATDCVEELAKSLMHSTDDLALGSDYERKVVARNTGLIDLLKLIKHPHVKQPPPLEFVGVGVDAIEVGTSIVIWVKDRETGMTFALTVDQAREKLNSGDLTGVIL